jgi:hypothetical protein
VALVNEVQAGRYGRLLQRLMNIKGSGSPTPQLAGDLEPGITLETDRDEWAYLAGDKLCSGCSDLAGAATFLSEIKIGNPIGSGILVIVDAVIVGAPANLLARFGLGATMPVVGANNGVPRDTRWFRNAGAIAAQSGARFAGTNNAGSTITIQTQLMRIVANTSLLVPVRTILHPADVTFSVDPVTVNTALCATFYWRERAIEPSELTVP